MEEPVVNGHLESMSEMVCATANFSDCLQVQQTGTVVIPKG